MNKQIYEQPTLLTFVVRCGGCLCGSVNAQSSAMPSFIEDSEEDW